MPAISLSPTSNDGLTLVNLRNHVAASTTFQAIVGAGDAASARAKVFIGAALDAGAVGENRWEDAAEDTMPRAIIRFGDEEIAQLLGTTVWNLTGQVLLTFEFPIPEQLLGNPSDQYLWIVDKSGLIRSEMAALVGAYPYCDIKQFTRASTGWAIPEQENGDEFLVAHFLLSIGGLI